MLSWSVSATFIGNLLGGAFFEPISQGALIGIVVYFYFRHYQFSLWVISASIIGAWVGDIAVMFTSYSLEFLLRLNPGEFTRTVTVIGPAYFIHLAILIMTPAKAETTKV